MKALLLTLILSLSLSFISAQQAGYKTYSSSIKMIAVQGEETYQWENKDNTVVLNYQNGDFKVRLKNRDFYNPVNPEPADPILEEEEREYLFQGILPVTDIINQKSTNQKYNVELQLICDDLWLNEPVNFEMTVTNPNPGNPQKSYRIFTLQGVLYNDQLDLPAFQGFNNEIELFINFNGFFEGGN